jgi:hypothetical protein
MFRRFAPLAGLTPPGLVALAPDDSGPGLC